jgi:hypothetical protein
MRGIVPAPLFSPQAEAFSVISGELNYRSTRRTRVLGMDFGAADFKTCAATGRRGMAACNETVPRSPLVGNRSFRPEEIS